MNKITNSIILRWAIKQSNNDLNVQLIVSSKINVN